MIIGLNELLFAASKRRQICGKPTPANFHSRAILSHLSGKFPATSVTYLRPLSSAVALIKLIGTVEANTTVKSDEWTTYADDDPVIDTRYLLIIHA